MKICGIIAEYNPFHKGHYHQMRSAKEKSGADLMVIVMSGMFVQRGVPAICDKFTRAKTAIDMGADIVIELPACYALSPAEYFALGGIGILNGINADYVSYGTEAISQSQRETVEQYINIQKSNSKEYNNLIKKYIAEGDSFFAAKISAYSELTNDRDIDVLSKPNAILESAYQMAIHTLKSDITPLPVDRLGDAYHASNPNSDIASATAIRKMINEGSDYFKYVPKEVFAALENADIAYHAQSKIYDYFLHSVFTNISDNKLSNIPDGSEEIANRIIASVRTSKNYDEFIESVTTRRITKARINRCMMHMILSIDAELIEDIRQYLPLYARVLGVSQNGRSALGSITKNASIPVVSSLAKYNPPTKLHNRLKDIDILAGNIYNYACNGAHDYNSDFTKRLYIRN